MRVPDGPKRYLRLSRVNVSGIVKAAAQSQNALSPFDSPQATTLWHNFAVRRVGNLRIKAYPGYMQTRNMR